MAPTPVSFALVDGEAKARVVYLVVQPRVRDGDDEGATVDLGTEELWVEQPALLPA